MSLEKLKVTCFKRATVSELSSHVTSFTKGLLYNVNNYINPNLAKIKTITMTVTVTKCTGLVKKKKKCRIQCYLIFSACFNLKVLQTGSVFYLFTCGRNF